MLKNFWGPRTAVNSATLLPRTEKIKINSEKRGQISDKVEINKKGTEDML